ncbi:GNAT family N-acetyltransferase [Actinophytocola sp.]|uniref:GNAT family N-acetyltransferase n=1 Tax=Actinophytocola sp. TaxID=1872138 RepID=UPI002ED22D76
MIDQLMRAAWPALEEVPVDGWLARFSGGVTQRANSVLPLAAPVDLDRALTRVEALYADRGLPAIFQLGPDSEPGTLDRVLAERGYETGSPTSIQTAKIDGVTRPAGVAVAEAPDQDWLDLWWAVDGRGDADALSLAVKILTGGPALYATINDEYGAAAVGRLALVGEWGGVYCMAVRADVRRRGLGAAVLAGLHAAGRERGVTRTWLHVLAENAAAQQLYARHGYAQVSTYHYRTQR